MTNNLSIPKILPLAIISGVILLFTISYLRGNLLVKKSEKELNPKKQITEAEASKYTLKELDTKTGKLRWKLTAKEGKTQDNLKSALIKQIDAEVYKDDKVIFELNAPYAKAHESTKKIYLFGEVIAKDKEGNFLLTSNQVALGMGTSIEAQKGFNLILKNSGTVIGENALINDDQTKIIIKKLKEGSFKDIILSGEKVIIEKEKNGELKNVSISKGGKIILKNQSNNSLYADSIKWKKNGDVEANNSVTYTSENKIFKADHLILKADKKLYAKGNVLILHGQTKCYASNLSLENNSLIVLSGKPKAIQGNKEIIADKITYNLDTSKVEAIGNVRTVVTQKEEEEESRKQG